MKKNDLITAVMKNTDMWGMDLTEIAGFADMAKRAFTMIRKAGVISAYASCLYTV